MDSGTALLGFHAIVADIAERADASVELQPVGARQQAPGPMAAGLERGQFLARRGDLVRARHIGEDHHAIGVADVEFVAQQRHAEGLVQPLHEHLLDFGDAIAIRVAQQRDAVRADPHGGGALHRADHGIVEDIPGGPVTLMDSAMSTSPLGST